jgi:SAM-dependent methyltransferase
MGREAWDERYRSQELVWGAEPNRFVAEAFGDRSPAGRALDLACGEGRNAIWLAKRGWSLTGVDYSAVALTHELAGAEGVSVDRVRADVTCTRARRPTPWC